MLVACDLAQPDEGYRYLRHVPVFSLSAHLARSLLDQLARRKLVQDAGDKGLVGNALACRAFLSTPLLTVLEMSTCI